MRRPQPPPRTTDTPGARSRRCSRFPTRQEDLDIHRPLSTGQGNCICFCSATTTAARYVRSLLRRPGSTDRWANSIYGKPIRPRGRSVWLPPHRIWQGRAGDMQSVFQLRSGRIILPLSYAIDRSWSSRGTGFDAFTWMGNFRTSALYSDDGGQTWAQSPAALETPTTAIGEFGAIEPVGIQLKDGRAWMLIRTTVGRFYETFSNDGVASIPQVPRISPPPIRRPA